MKVTIQKIYPEWLPNRMAEMTTHGKVVKAPKSFWFKSAHSPIRGFEYWIEFHDLPTFVSVHFVRHKFGVEHFVKSNRDDLYLDKHVVIDRNSPVNHGMKINAQALITMGRKRLCYKAHIKTVAAFRKMVKGLGRVEPEIAKYIVPECVYRGFCPEGKECKPGVEKVMRAYADYPPRPLEKGIK